MNTDASTSKDIQRVPWARPGDYREEDSNLIIGNREGLQALRAAIDTALDKGEAFVEESEVDFSHIQLSEQARPDCDETGTNGKLALFGCLLILCPFVAIFLIGCVEVIRYLF